MRSPLHPTPGRTLHCAAAALLISCTTEQAPDAATRGGSNAASVCQRTARGEAGDLALARCLATPELTAPTKSAKAPVTVYFDRSGSMRGFLDPSYPTRVRTDYRSVIDRLVVGLAPSGGFSFGSELRTIEPTLATLGDRGFYTDKDTRTEQALAVIARDSVGASSHILVGDGRRGSPTSGDGQFVRMRELADRWIEQGGSFIVATSLAPFKTVATDPSGCRGPATATTEPQTCPLYAFGFIAPGDGARVTATLASVFEHVFVWPAPTIPPADLTITPTDPSRRDIRLERRWAAAAEGTPVVRVRGDAATNNTLAATITLRDTSTAEGHGYAEILEGQNVDIRIWSRGFTPAAATHEWMPVEARGALVRPGSRAEDGTLSLDFVTRGATAPTSMYRIDLVPTGAPSWLEQFDAEDATDVVRTYGLGRLFESFRARAKGGEATPLGRFFIVAS
jgi:hypothetical protein